MNELLFGMIPVYRDSKSEKWLFLLVQCQRGHWGFPKGHHIEGEDEMDTALRELIEETGVSKINIMDNISFNESFDIRVENNETHKKTIKFFLGIVDSPDVSIRDTDEIQAVQWCSFNEAFEIISYDHHKKILRDAKAYLENLIVKEV